MFNWFSTLAAGNELPMDAASELQERGFVILPGPVRSDRMELLANAYTAAVASATGDDIKIGSTSTKVNDLVNRGVELDASTRAQASIRRRKLSSSREGLSSSRRGLSSSRRGLSSRREELSSSQPKRALVEPKRPLLETKRPLLESKRPLVESKRTLVEPRRTLVEPRGRLRRRGQRR